MKIIVHIHGPEALLTVIKPPQCSINYNSYGYSVHILDFVLCYPIVLVTFHYTVLDSLALYMQLYGKILGSVDNIICGVALHCEYCTHGLPLKIYLGYDVIFSCEGYLMMHNDLARGCITEDSVSIVELRFNFEPSVPKKNHWET